jgi:hypothetical protein
MNYLLSEVEEPIFQALERLVAKDIGLRPFVHVSKVGRPDVFVQFARLVRNGVLCFDVPKLEIVLAPTTPADGAKRAVVVLYMDLGVSMDERVLIREEEGGSGGKGIPFWKRPWLRPA